MSNEQLVTAMIPFPHGGDKHRETMINPHGKDHLLGTSSAMRDRMCRLVTNERVLFADMASPEWQPPPGRLSMVPELKPATRIAFGRRKNMVFMEELAELSLCLRSHQRMLYIRARHSRILNLKIGPKVGCHNTGPGLRHG